MVKPSRPVLVFITVALAISLGIELGVSRLFDPKDVKILWHNRFYPPNRVPTVEESIAQWQTYNALNHATPVDVLVSGDCAALLGIVPEIVSRESGLSSWNAGTLGVQATGGHAETLKRYVQKVGAPLIFVYAVTISVFMRPPENFWLARTQEWLSQLDGFTVSQLPSYLLRYSLQSLVFNLSLHADYPDEIVKFKRPRGNNMSDADVRELTLKTRGYIPRIEPDQKLPTREEITGNFHEGYVAGLQQMAELTQRNNIRFVLMLNPLPTIANTTVTQKTTDDLVTKLNEVLKEFSHVQIVKPRIYASELYESTSHLNEKGAEQSSVDLGRYLNQLKSSARAF